jgi:glycosyltransferase involved in cell wall biosynthesis
MGDVIHPPVTVKEVDIGEKKEQVLLLGRISRHKGIEDIARIANENSIRVIVAGYVNRGDEGFVEKLRMDGGKNVEIMENVSEGEKGKLMAESSTILSMNRKEHFGLAIAEAMKYGCVPVVPKSGGQWSDIVEFGKYGLGYQGQDELVEMLKKSFSYTRTERFKVAESVKRFSVEEFSRKIANLIEKISPNRK